MKTNFRQGLISYQQSGAQAVFLLPGSVANSVTLSVAPQPTIATIAHGSSDYLFKFDQTVPNAWQITPGVDNWLFIEQNMISGALVHGTTTLEPKTGSVEPPSSIAGQMWFDTNDTVMKVYNGTKWIPTPSLVVAKVVGGNTNQIQSYSTGSSVGLSIPGSPGFLMLDSQLRPLRTSTGELLTSDTSVRIKTTVGTSGVLSSAVTGFVPVRANQAIPAMSLVYFSGEDAVSLASSNPALVDLKTPIGIIEHDLATNEVGTITQQGEIVYDQWNWGEADFGKPLYCGFNGQLTTTRPQGVQAYRVGYIKNAKTILFYIDSETQAQVVSSPGSIISGTPPISAVTSLNGSGEIITTLSMEAATDAVDGYMTAAQAEAIGSFDARITTNTLDIAFLENEKADIAHTHVIADVTGLETRLDDVDLAIAAKMPKITGTTGNFTSIKSDGTLLDSGYAFNAFALAGHVHTIADVTNLQTELNGKAPLVHTHAIADVVGLQIDLDARAFVNHTHVIAEVSGLQTALNNKAPLAHTHEIINVNGLQEELDARALIIHTHEISDVINLQTALNGKAAVAHTHVIGDTTGLQDALDAKAEVVHTHVSTDITDFDEAVTDRVSSMLVQGTNITLAYNDDGNELTISTQPQTFQGGGEYQVMGNDGLGNLIPVAMNVRTNDSSFSTEVNIGENTHGNVQLFTTNGDGTSGHGGNFTINAGNAPIEGVGRGGDLLLLGGAGSQEGTEGLGGGNVLIYGGAAGHRTGDTNGGGSIKIQAGQSQAGVSNADSSFIALQNTNPTGSYRALVLNQWGAMGWAGGNVTDHGMATYGQPGQLLTSSGINEQPSWRDPVRTSMPNTEDSTIIVDTTEADVAYLNQVMNDFTLSFTGQRAKIIVCVQQDSTGGHVVTADGSKIDFGTMAGLTDLSGVSAEPNSYTYLGFVYHPMTNKYRLVAVSS